MTSPASADVFDPPGLVWHRVSPRLVTVRLISAAIWIGLPFLAGVVAAVLLDLVWLWAVPAVLLLAFGWIAWLVPRQVGALGYAEREDDFVVRRGIMFRSLVVVPYGRMQLVDVQAGPLDRALGVAKVQLHTASATTDAVVPGLPPEDASRLRDRLAARGEARLAGL